MAKHSVKRSTKNGRTEVARSILAVLLWTYRLGWAIYVTSHLS